MNKLKHSFKRLLSVWNEVRPDRMATALAYYGLFSIVPLLYIALTIAGVFVSNRVLMDQVVARLTEFIGPDAARFVSELLQNRAQQQSGGSLLASLIGFALIYRVLARIKPSWRSILIGATYAALIFLIGAIIVYLAPTFWTKENDAEPIV